MRGLIYSIWEVLEVVIIAAVTVFLIRAVIVQPFLISGASMEQTFIDGDYVLVDELTYEFKQPERGDIIVFRYPLNPKLFYIKRIIGVPGDQVMVDDGVVSVNGEQLREVDYVGALLTIGRANTTVSENQLFVMGDNRSHSYDSRNFGLVPFENIIGTVRLRLLPAAQAETFDRPVY